MWFQPDSFAYVNRLFCLKAFKIFHFKKSWILMLSVCLQLSNLSGTRLAISIWDSNISSGNFIILFVQYSLSFIFFSFLFETFFFFFLELKCWVSYIYVPSIFLFSSWYKSCIFAVYFRNFLPLGLSGL